MDLDTIYNIDCIEGLKRLEDNCIDLIVTSPPYNRGWYNKDTNTNHTVHKSTKVRNIVYGDYLDNLPPNEYADWQVEVIKECQRVLKPSGSIIYNHCDILKDHLTIHPTFVYQFPIKQIIVWDRKNTPKLDKSYFFPITEYLFWIKKDYEARVWFERSMCGMQTNVWNVAPEMNNSHPAPFPLDIPLNCAMSLCPKDGVLLDPFMGSGTTAVAAIKAQRHFIGFELKKEYYEKAMKRIQNERAQLTLNFD